MPCIRCHTDLAEGKVQHLQGMGKLTPGVVVPDNPRGCHTHTEDPELFDFVEKSG